MTDPSPWVLIQPYQDKVEAPNVLSLAAVRDKTGESNRRTWIWWTQTFAGLDSLASIARRMVVSGKINIKEPGKTKILNGLDGVHQALQAINNGFIAAIHDIDAGKNPTIHAKPQPIPNWNEQNSSSSSSHALTAFKASWEIVRPALQFGLQYWQNHPGSTPETALVALSGLLDASDALIDDISTIIG